MIAIIIVFLVFALLITYAWITILRKEDKSLSPLMQKKKDTTVINEPTEIKRNKNNCG